MNSLRSLGTSSLGEVTTTPEVVPVDVSSPNFQMLACTPAPWDGHSVTPSTSSLVTHVSLIRFCCFPVTVEV